MGAMEDDERIAAVENVPADGSFLFTVAADGEEREAILVQLSDGTISGWFNYCMHWTDVALDTGDGAPTRDGELVCRKHAATFEKNSGVCTHGPCEGARLEPVEVAVEDGAVYLVDGNYEFVRAGVEDDDPVDLSTSPGSRVGF